MARSLNRVQLIGNLTRDPELRYTPTGTAVCSFGMATNRSWTTDTGEKRDEAEFHRIVAWNKLAELCSQFLTKGKKVYVEGRLSTRSWNAQDGTQKTTTEIIISDMILIDSSGLRSGTSGQGRTESEPAAEPKEEAPKEESLSKSKSVPSGKSKKETKDKQDESVRQAQDKKEEPVQEAPNDEVAPDDIPF